MSDPHIPYIDPKVNYTTLGQVKYMKVSDLKSLEYAIVLRDTEGAPYVVIIPFKIYQKILGMLNKD